MTSRMTLVAAVLAAIATPALAKHHAPAGHASHAMAMKPITKAEVEAAQKEWGDGIVAISATKANGGDYAARAKAHLDKLYAYDLGPVLFKPTLAAADQFRGTYDEALSYFVKGSNPEDTGFAIKGWTNVRFENEGIITDHDSAAAMGNYFFTGPDGKVTKVEYTFGYVRGPDGKLKINVHHSSVPYQP